jgi:hypothetical protein
VSVWWRLRQWVYARPPVAVAGTVLALLIAGFAGWQSAHWLAADGAVQAVDTTVYEVKGASTVRLRGRRVVDHSMGRTRTVTLPSRSRTVVVVKGVTQIVPTATTLNRRVVVESRPLIIKTVTKTHLRTVVATRSVTQPGGTVTVTQTQREPAQTEFVTQVPPGHARPTETVTVTVTQAAVTVTVTTSRGH